MADPVTMAGSTATVMASGPFPQVVFSGGGLRCIWQGGFMHVARDALGIAPDRITGVSGGAFTAAGFIARINTKILEQMCAALSLEDWNITIKDLNGEYGRTPHQRVYDKIVRTALDDDAQRAVANGPQFQILLGHPPSDRSPDLAGTAMQAAFEAELLLKSTPHFDWAESAGMTTSLVDANEAARNGRLADLILAAGTVPPIFRIPTWEGKPVIDGAMADQAPMPDPDEGPTLVLLTRQFRNLPDVPDRYYVSPSDDMPADQIDFTDSEKLRQTWALGERDGEEFVKTWNRK